MSSALSLRPGLQKSQPAAPVPRVTRIAIAGVGEASEEAADPA